MHAQRHATMYRRRSEGRGHPAGVRSLPSTMWVSGMELRSSGLTTGVFSYGTISALLVCPFRAHAFITVSSQGEFNDCLPNSRRYTFSRMFCSSQFLVFSILCSAFIFVAELMGFGIAKKRDLTNSHLWEKQKPEPSLAPPWFWIKIPGSLQRACNSVLAQLATPFLSGTFSSTVLWTHWPNSFFSVNSVAQQPFFWTREPGWSKTRLPSGPQLTVLTWRLQPGPTGHLPFLALRSHTNMAPGPHSLLQGPSTFASFSFFWV